MFMMLLLASTRHSPTREGEVPSAQLPVSELLLVSGLQHTVAILRSLPANREFRIINLT